MTATSTGRTEWAQGGFSTNPTRSEQLLFLTDDQLRQGIELMFFAYRGFTADPDRILAERQYGRAHHRAIHFINRRPGLTVNELLDFLGVTKQSLNRVLRQLVDDGLVESRVGVEDRRHRNLHLTAAGAPARAGALGRPAPADARRLLDRRPRGGARLPQGARADDRPRAARPGARLARGRPMSAEPQPHVLVVDDDAAAARAAAEVPRPQRLHGHAAPATPPTPGGCSKGSSST